MDIQSLIHKLEVQDGRRGLHLLLIGLAAVVLGLAYNVYSFQAFWRSEAMDAAQAARNISAGRWFKTDAIRPFSLTLVAKQRTDQKTLANASHPDLMNPPLYPAALGLWLKAAPVRYDIKNPATFRRYQPETLIAIFNQGWLFLTGFLVFLLAKRLFDDGVALMAVMMFAVTEMMWRFSISGLSTMMLMALVVAASYLLTVTATADQEAEAAAEGNEGDGEAAPDGQEPPSPKSWRWRLGMSAAIGGLLGLAFLTRYAAGLLIVPAAIFLAFVSPGKRWASPLAALACFLLVATPWMARNYHLSGFPLGLASFTWLEGVDSPAAEDALARFKLELGGLEKSDVLRKFVGNLSAIVVHGLPSASGNWVGALFLGALFFPFQSLGLRRLRWFVLLATGVLAVAQAFASPRGAVGTEAVSHGNLIVLLAPLFIVYGAGMYSIIADQWKLPFPEARLWVNAAAVLAVGAPMIIELGPPRRVPISYPPYYPPVIQYRAHSIRADEIMMSDIPAAVAWYGDRRCIGATRTVEEFLNFDTYERVINALYLTTKTTDARFASKVMAEGGGWSRFAANALLQESLPEGFPLPFLPNDQQSDQLFLTDWQRSRERAAGEE